MAEMRFTRGGPNTHNYTDGDHTFHIVRVQFGGQRNGVGYKVYHTGPRFDLVAEAKRSRRARPTNNGHENHGELIRKPIPKMRDVRTEIALWLIDQASLKMALAAPTKAVVAA